MTTDKIQMSDQISCTGATLKPVKKRILFQSKTLLAGHFKMVVTRPDGSSRVVADWQPNLITDVGLDNIGNGSHSVGNTPNEWIGYCRVGTGQTEPAVGDLALAVHVGETVRSASFSTGVQVAIAPFYRWQRITYVFAVGNATGNLTEIGAGKALASGDLSTRSLIEDVNGDPTTVTVLSDEELTVIYEIRSYVPDVTQQLSQMTIDSKLYNNIRLPSAIDDTPGAAFHYGGGMKSFSTYRGDTLPNIDDHFGEPLIFMAGHTATLSPYGSGTKLLDSSCVIPASEANNGAKGITALKMIGNFQSWQISFTQDLADYGIPHDNTNELTLNFRHSWDRYTPP